MRISVPMTFDRDRLYVADMTEHAQLDETMEGLVDWGSPVAAANSTILGATAIVALGTVNINKKVDDYYGRTINVTGNAAGNVVLYGRDYLNQQITQAVAVINGTVATTKAFKFLDKVVSSTLAGNISFGPGPKLGMPFVVSKIIEEYDNGAAVAAPTLTAADTAVQTSSTGDPRGTVTPTAALDGIINVQMKVRFNQDAVGGLHGRVAA